MTFHKIVALSSLILLSTCLTACGITPSAEKNIRGAEYTGAAIKEEETTPQPLFNKSMNTVGIYSIAISHDGRYVAVGRTDLVELWDIVRAGEGKTIEGNGIRDVTSLQSRL